MAKRAKRKKKQLFVSLELEPTRVRHKDVVFFVYRGNLKFGELRVSQGAVVWRGRGDKLGRKYSWARFDEQMQGARLAERRAPGTPTSVPRRKRRER